MAQQMIEKQVIFEGKRIRLEVHHLRDDETGRKHHRELIVHPGAVVVIPFISRDRFVLIKQKRYAIGNKKILELPAGTLEANEIPMNAAGRELLEETGYLAGRMQVIGSFYSSPGIMSEKIYAFAAYDMEKREQHLDEGEEIDDIIDVTIEDAIELIRTGQIEDGKTIATILMYHALHRSDPSGAPRPVLVD